MESNDERKKIHMEMSMESGALPNIIYCSVCEKTFSQNKSLYKHLRNIHKLEPLLDKRAPQFECESCKKEFASKSSLNKHTKKFHDALSDHNYLEEPKRKTRLICCFQSCDSEFTSQEQYRAHLQKYHDLRIEAEDLCFVSLQAFENWKNEMETQSLTFYTLDTAGKTLANGNIKLYYNCHRSLKYNSKGDNKRAAKSMGSNKINKACPAKLEVEVMKDKTRVSVKFYKTHCGHEIQIGRIMLDKKTRAQIADKLKGGVTFEHILDSVRDSHLDNGTLERISLLERKDLHNIVRDFNIEYTTKRHQDDAISIQIWVNEMKDLGEDCPVLCYKGQNEEDNFLEKDDFVLILMTNFQEQQLLKFGHDKICIDGTHGTNGYDIQLYTIMIVDEFQSGCPVAFCFSNRADEKIFILFFEKIKSKVGLIVATVFMSDDYPAFYNAWCFVMTEVPNRLLCTWHIDRNWRSNLNKVKGGPEKQGLVYKTLRMLLERTSIDEFKPCLQQVLHNLLTDDNTKVFGQYFEKYYFNRPECWAYCYRLGLGINTNMYLESYHKILKHIYLQGQQVKRLDKSIDALMKLSRDNYFNRLIKLAKNHSTSKVQNVHKSHRASQNIKSEYVETIEEKKSWMVPSTQNCNKKYFVMQVQQPCTTPCLKCTYCNICIHAFKCSCTDNVIKLNMCKHIHFCAQKVLTTGTENQNKNINVNYEKELLKISKVKPTPTSHSNGHSISRKIEHLMELFKTVTLDDGDAKLIEKKIDQVIDILSKGKEIHLKEVVDINIQRKVTKQARLLTTKRNIKMSPQKSPRNTSSTIRLYSTKKKAAKTSNLKKPSIYEQQAIKNGLNDPIGETINVNTSFDHLYT